MASAPNPGLSAATASGLASVGIVRLSAIAAPHLAALLVMLQTETDFGSRFCFLVAWGILNTIDAPYLPLVVQEAAGIPLDPSFAEQKDIMLRCQGIFYACRGGAEARRFNRLLLDAGWIHGL